MVFPRKTLQHSSCEPRLSVDLQRKTRATWHALITQAFLPPPVLKVISCDYVFVHPGLGVMGVVECFRVFARLFDFLHVYIERLHQEVVGFP